MNKLIVMTALAISLIACGGSEKALLQENTDLIVALGGENYLNLSDAERYDAADYLFRKGQLENARTIFEDLVTNNPGIIAAKYKLARIYLRMDTVTFSAKGEKGKMVYTNKNGKELGERVLTEIYDNDPWFLPVYSDLMILYASRSDYDKVKAVYEKAQTLHKDFNTTDYRVGYLTMGQADNPGRFTDGKTLVEKGKKTYLDLYDSYKNLGNIYTVQHRDTTAFSHLKKAVDARTEAVDLFYAYCQLAVVCETLYHGKEGNEGHKTMALRFACTSLQYFPGYKPATFVIKRLTGVAEPTDSLSDSVQVYREAAAAYCSTAEIPEADRITIGSGYQSVIPPSLLREQLKERKVVTEAQIKKGSKTPWLIAGGIALGAGGVFVLLTVLGGGDGSGGGGSSALGGTPPALPNGNQ